MPYSASQLVSLACQITKTPGMIAQAGQFLNIILADYAQTIDMDTIRKTIFLDVGGQTASYALPSDYLRGREVFYNISGEPVTVNEIPLEDYDKLFVGSGVASYPESWATDMSTTPPTIYFWPPPEQPVQLTIRYQPQTVDIASPESSSTIPWFPNQRVLLKDLCVDLLMLGDDTARKQDLEREVMERMRKYLVMDDDKEGYAQTVKLDARRFRPSYNSARATKYTVW